MTTRIKMPKFRSWMAHRRNRNVYDVMGMPVPGYWLRRADRRIDAAIKARQILTAPADRKEDER